MARFTSTLVLMVTVSGAEACPSFGFETAHLSQFFCRQIDEFAGPSTRNLNGSSADGSTQDGLTQPHPDWMAIPDIERAWRSDPAKTLKLIDRIRDAGGRAAK